MKGTEAESKVEKNRNSSFEFKQCVSILKSTAKRARDLRELREQISTVSEDSIFHHTCQYFLKGRVREYTNDFAQWTGETLEESALAEQLSNIDPYVFRNLSELRKALLSVIDDYLENFPEPKAAMPGEDFCFNETISVVFSAGIKAKNLAEFLVAIKYVDSASIYYHFYEARTRLGGKVDDFSRWFEDVLRERELAEKIRCIDPFMHSIEGIRTHIVEVVEEKVKRDMTVTGTGK